MEWATIGWDGGIVGGKRNIFYSSFLLTFVSLTIYQSDQFCILFSITLGYIFVVGVDEKSFVEYVVCMYEFPWQYNISSQRGAAAVHKASGAGQTAAVTLLLDCEADVHAVDEVCTWL